jgi:hypothetical protein
MRGGDAKARDERNRMRDAQALLARHANLEAVSGNDEAERHREIGRNPQKRE